MRTVRSRPPVWEHHDCLLGRRVELVDPVEQLLETGIGQATVTNETSVLTPARSNSSEQK
jgi:hypothetical protein